MYFRKGNVFAKGILKRKLYICKYSCVNITIHKGKPPAPPSDSWLRQGCSKLISTNLTRKIRALFFITESDFPANVSAQHLHWKDLHVLGQIPIH